MGETALLGSSSLRFAYAKRDIAPSDGSVEKVCCSNWKGWEKKIAGLCG